MFRNLPTIKSFPSAIGLPFLSSYEDAQLKFKSGENGIKRLTGEEVVCCCHQPGHGLRSR